ncbi:MAG TPA: SGNH/GDSL hydrolase family protein [Opitutus sp.]|nr:SGNH/GDSL hydrolase family protein [Opitutus sp.]
MRFLRHLLLAAALAAPALAQPSATAFHRRGGLPHVADIATRGDGELRVAYLGGSITAAANGWRSLTTAHLAAAYPKLHVVEIAAGLPGTGSDLGVCRLERDVLRHRPDLLFVEFAVNDASTPPDRIERTMEGIVRQTRRANPQTDIFFVYTVSTPGLPDLEAGRFPVAATAMERVAGHYAIPSLHFGVEIARRVSAGTLLFKAPDAPDDPRTFSLDGVHPTAAGHRIYFAAIEQVWPTLVTAPASKPTTLPAPLHADNWSHAALREIGTVNRTGEWSLVSPDDPNLRGATKALLPPTWRTAEAGAALTVEFSGRTFGLLGIAAPDSGQFRVTIEGEEPVTDTFFDHYVTPSFCRPRPWFYPRPLADGPHRARIDLLAEPVDKAAIKAKAGKTLAEPDRYAANRLTLSGVLLVESAEP